MGKYAPKESLKIIDTYSVDKRGIRVALKSKKETREIEIRIDDLGRLMIVSEHPINVVVKKEYKDATETV